MRIIVNDVILTKDEMEFLVKLVKLGIQYQTETYNFAKEIAIENTPEGIKDALNELLNNNQEDIQIIYDLVNNKYLHLKELID